MTTYRITKTEKITYTRVVDEEDMRDLLSMTQEEEQINQVLQEGGETLRDAVGDALDNATPWDAFDYEWLERHGDVEGLGMTVERVEE